MYSIRKIEKKDNAVLATLIRDVFEEFDAPRAGTVFSDSTTDNLYELFLTPGSALWVAEDNGRVAGCCGVFPSKGLDNDTAELVKFYTAKESRGKGIGKQLIEKSIASAKEFGYEKLYIESLPVFSKAIAIYQQNGFLFLERPLGSSAHPTCDVWMVKDLRGASGQ